MLIRPACLVGRVVDLPLMPRCWLIVWLDRVAGPPLSPSHQAMDLHLKARRAGLPRWVGCWLIVPWSA